VSAVKLRPKAVLSTIGVASLLLASTRGVSADSGPSWRPIALRGTLVHSVAVSPTKPEVWIASTQSGIWRTGDDGKNWAPVGLAGRAIWAASWAGDGVHAYAAGLGGDTVAISSDSGMNWVVSDAGLEGRSGYAVEPLDPGGHSLVLGTDAGVFFSRDGGRLWSHAPGIRERVAVDSFVTVGGSILAGLVPGGVAASDDAGMHWRPVVPALGGGGGVMALARPSAGAVVAGTMGHAVWSGVVQGTWIRSGSGLPSLSHGASVVADSSRGGVLYVGTLGQGVYKSTDGGHQWRPLTAGLSGSQRIVLSLALTEGGSQLVAGTASGIVAFSGVDRVVQAGPAASPLSELAPLFEGQNGLNAAFYILHLIAVIWWVATVLVGALGLLFALREPALSAPVWRFLRPKLALSFLLSSAAGLLTGVYNTAYNSAADSPVTTWQAVDDLLHTGYGVTLVVKHLLILVVVALALVLWARREVVDRAIEGTVVDASVRSRIALITVAMLVAMLLLLVVAGLLPFEHHVTHEISIPGT
jgi:photosystem II stability/assembly factor-like uncharacterized protein